MILATNEKSEIYCLDNVDLHNENKSRKFFDFILKSLLEGQDLEIQNIKKEILDNFVPYENQNPEKLEKYLSDLF